MTTTFESLQAIADAVLFEGYVLYPYRASSAKNQYRFPFGVLAPRAWSEATRIERWWLETALLIAPQDSTRVRGRVRFLAASRRVDSEEGKPWDEGKVEDIDFAFALDEPLADFSVPFAIGPRRGAVTIHAEALAADRPLWRVRFRIANLTPFATVDASRHDIVPWSLLGTHLLATVDDGQFLSMQAPPPWAQRAVEETTLTGLYPVLAGAAGTRDAVLAAPIILYDHPQIAPESPGDFFDATEIDELLALRTLTLTDAEKREVRATDPRGAAILDRVESMPPETWSRLHGAWRSAGEPPRDVRATFAPGTRVRLLASPRKTDAQDVLYAGHMATVEELFEDVDGRTYLGVTVDDDPGRDLRRLRRQFLHYLPDEVELCASGERPGDGPDFRPRVLVAGIGNVFFGDDGFGVEVAARLGAERLPPNVSVRDFGVRGLHLAYELCEPYDLVILIDCAPRGGKPGTLYTIEPTTGGTPPPEPNAHGMDVPTVLITAKALGATLPRIVLVGCEPATIEESMELSEPVRRAIEPAVATICKLIETPPRATFARALSEENRHET